MVSHENGYISHAHPRSGLKTQRWKRHKIGKEAVEAAVKVRHEGKVSNQAIESVYPQAQVQLCIVHMIRNSLKFVSWKERKKAAETALEQFREDYDERFPAIGKSWQDNWDNIVPFFDYPPEIRKVIDTTHSIESLNRSFRKISRSRNLFPSVESLYKLFYLAIQNISKKWTMPIQNWPAALNRFTIEFSERITNEYK